MIPPGLSTGLLRALRAVVIVVALIVIIGFVALYFANSRSPSRTAFAVLIVATIALLGALGRENKTCSLHRLNSPFKRSPINSAQRAMRVRSTDLKGTGKTSGRACFRRSSSRILPMTKGAPNMQPPRAPRLSRRENRGGKRGPRDFSRRMLRYGLGDHVIGGESGGVGFLHRPKGRDCGNFSTGPESKPARSYHNPWGEWAIFIARLGFPRPPITHSTYSTTEDPNVVALAQSMGAAISPVGDAKEPFWSSGAAKPHRGRSVHRLTDQPGEEKTLNRLSDILNRSKKSFTTEYVARMAGSKAFSGSLRRLSAPFIDMPDVTYGGIMGHVTQAASFLTDPQILAATATSSFTMARPDRAPARTGQQRSI